MLQRIKQILLTQYIGVIVIGLLAAQGILQLISLILLPVNWQLIRLGARTHSVLVEPESAFMHWDVLASTAARAVLYLAMAWLLFRWLYGDKDVEAGENVSTEEI